MCISILFGSIYGAYKPVVTGSTCPDQNIGLIVCIMGFYSVAKNNTYILPSTVKENVQEMIAYISEIVKLQRFSFI